MGDIAEELRAHLETVQNAPGTALDAHLIDTCCTVLPLQLSRNDTVALAQQLSTLVTTVQTDPSPLIRLLTLLLGQFSFSEILGLAPDIDYVRGLDVRNLPYNPLILAILRKAARSPSDAASIAARTDAVSALITLWLSTPEPGIGQEAGEVLYDLLAADTQPETAASVGPGRGLFWKRVFQDRDVCTLFYSLTTSRTHLSAHELSRNQRTLAQARLLAMIPRLCVLNWSALTRSHPEGVEAPFTANPGRGLLGFAVTDMVDTKDDVLMHKCLIEFYSELIATVARSGPDTQRQSSLSLDFLIDAGVHARLTDFYSDPSEARHGALEVHFLYSSMAKYVATYASHYPDRFMDDERRGPIMARLEQALSISSLRWVHQEPPKYDLHLLASLPRVALLPRRDSTGRTRPSVISLLPTKQTVPDALNTLAAVFKGPSTVDSLTYPEESPMMSSIDERGLSEAQAARSLYFLYVTRYNPRLFEDLVSHADSVALTDLALASINVLSSIVNSTWAPLSDRSLRGMLTEAELLALLPNPPPAMPFSGPQALLAPPSLEHTLPYLLKPARSFANLVGGRGDSENAAYKVALAKYDVLKALHERLQAAVADEPEEGYEEILATLKRSVARGPWSHQGDVGGHVATMEL